VVRSTSLLRAIKRKFPSSKLTWVTDAPAHQLLKFNPLIDRVLTTSSEDQLILRALSFDIGLVIDKSLKAAGVLALTKCDIIYGFVVESLSGAILPATKSAEELWSLGLSDFAKFHVNKKPETQLMIEALELGSYQRDEYFVPLTDEELHLALERRAIWKADEKFLIGLNTGCSAVLPAKKWTVEYHRRVIQALLAQGFKSLVLLGGPEDKERNEQIANGLSVISSPTQSGLRDGMVSVQACDLVVTGDSLGMHMAIALKKYVVAWFGPSCAQEIDLYDRGIALQAEVPCSPCWKRTCEKNVMCYDQVRVESVSTAVIEGLQNLSLWSNSAVKVERRKDKSESGEEWPPISTSKQRFSETSV
jgi:heptosyltransferase II